MDKSIKNEKTILLARLFFVCLIFSFAGFIWETVHVSLLAKELVDRSFLFGPICPIYGTTMVISYLLMGPPQAPKTFLKKTKGKWYQYLLYAIIAISLPTLVELVVGLGCEKLFNIRLWDYSHYVINLFDKEIPLHYKGYIALPISCIWLVLIFISMGFVFPMLLKLIEKIPLKKLKLFSIIFAVIMAVDIIVSIVFALL